MVTVIYILVGIAAVLLIIAIPVLTLRALLLMARMEDTRRDVAALTTNVEMSLQHANRFFARSQDTMEKLRHTVERLDRLLTLLQPAATVGGLLSGARRAMSGRREPPASSPEIESEGESHD